MPTLRKKSLSALRKADMTTAAFKTRVKKLEEKKQVTRGWKDAAGNSQFETERIGYGLLLEGSSEWIIFREPVAFQVGQEVILVITTDFAERDSGVSVRLETIP